MSFDIGLLCPQCKRTSTIVIENNSINVRCLCGYEELKKISEPIIIKHNTTEEKCDPFKSIINTIKLGYAHLNIYFKTLKDNILNQLLSSINKVESSYEKSVHRNSNILSSLRTLIDNYDGTNEMKNTIWDTNINIYNCDYPKDINEVIKFYNDYYINEERGNYKRKEINNQIQFTIPPKRIKKNKEINEIALSIDNNILINIKSIKTITDHTSSVNSLFRLKDGRIASCSDDNTIRIYNPSYDYHCDQVIRRHSEGIRSICELEDGTIVSCSYDKSIIIGDYTIKNAHNDRINKVITLPNNRIASCSKDKTIKIWKSNKPYSDTPIKVLEGHAESVTSLLYIKERDIMISGSIDGTLHLWNMSTYQCDKVINGVYCCWTNALYQIDNDRVIVGYKNEFYIVNIDKCVVEKTIKDESFGFVSCFIKLRDGKTILCGCANGTFCFYDKITGEYIISKNFKKNHEEDIVDLILINDKLFASCSFDSVIKIWNY